MATETKPAETKPAAGEEAGTQAKTATVQAIEPLELLGYYEQMLLIRRFEEKAGQLYGMGLIQGFCHLYIGQEAVVVGLQATAKEQDTVITTYRDHGHMLACGMDAKGVMAELTGRRGGYSKGKGGSMHMFSREKRFYGGHGIVGASVPLGAGLAFAHRYMGDGGINYCYYGDGAANQGQVYEAYNMAALWKLPIIFIIENNRYAMGTAIERASAKTDFYRRGEAFGIPGVSVDGMNVLDVKAAGEEVAAKVRAGEGPYVMELQTYRYRGHSMSDPAKYRTKEEVSEVRKTSDPIERLRALILDGGYSDEGALKEIDRKVKAVVNESAEFAQTDPEPDPSELYTDVLIEA